MWRDDEERKRKRWDRQGKRRNERMRRANEMEGRDGRARRSRKRKVGIAERARRRKLWCERQEGGKGEHECRKSRRKLSNKDVSYFYILGEDKGVFRARFMVLLLCLLLRQMLLSRSARSRRRAVFTKGTRLREDVYFVGRANMICRLLSAQKIVALDSLKWWIFHKIRRNISRVCQFSICLLRS